MKFSLAHPNPGKRSAENLTKISRQISRHFWQRKTEKKFTSALLQGSCSEIFAENSRKPQIGLRRLRSVTFSSAASAQFSAYQKHLQGAFPKGSATQSGPFLSETSKRHLKRQQPRSDAKSDANFAAIVQFLTCHFTVVAFRGRRTILQKSSFHGC